VIDAAPGTGWYVYGFAADADSLEHAAADAGPIRLVRHDGLVAIVGEVPLDEFGEHELADHLNDPAWLEEKARRHENVLQAFAARTAVVPLRFGSIHGELDEVRRLLESRQSQLHGTIDRVRGRVEIGVKAWVDTARLADTLRGEEGASSSGTGREYLQRRRQEQRRLDEVRERCAELAAEAHGRLLSVAVEGVQNRPHPPELTGRPEMMLLNGAYLVPAADTALEAEVGRLAAEHGPFGVTYELTGPWPPHNFVDDRDGAA